MNITLIQELEEKLRQAMLASDVLVLDELIADDLVFTMHTGQFVNKQFDLEAHRDGSYKFSAVNTSEQQIRFYGGVAIVTVRAELAGLFQGQPFAEVYRFTRVWAQPQGRWQVVAGHVSQVQEASNPQDEKSPGVRQFFQLRNFNPCGSIPRRL
jgi:ketosteroid isomerase-like protein